MMAVVSIHRMNGLLDLAREQLPRAVQSDGEFTDWNVVGPALVGIGADLFEGIMAATPPRGRIRAEILARSLSEYAIGFAWLAGPDDDGTRGGRMKQLERYEFIQRGKGGNKLQDQIAQRAAYRENLKRWGFPDDLLGDATRARLERLKRDTEIGDLPNAFDMAFQADERWMPEIDLVSHNPFAIIYFTLFAGPSFVTHPSVTAVSEVTAGSPPTLVVGAPNGLGESEMPYGQSLLTFTNMLLVASRALGWPDEDAIRGVLGNQP
jgi:hypothetical protein